MAKIPKETLEYFRQQGAKGGKLSAQARMEKLTAEERSEIARKAAAARWADKDAKPAAEKVAAKKTRTPVRKATQKPKVEQE